MEVTFSVEMLKELLNSGHWTENPNEATLIICKYP